VFSFIKFHYHGNSAFDVDPFQFVKSVFFLVKLSELLLHIFNLFGENCAWTFINWPNRFIEHFNLYIQPSFFLSSAFHPFAKLLIDFLQLLEVAQHALQVPGDVPAAHLDLGDEFLLLQQAEFVGEDSVREQRVEEAHEDVFVLQGVEEHNGVAHVEVQFGLREPEQGGGAQDFVGEGSQVLGD